MRHNEDEEGEEEERERNIGNPKEKEKKMIISQRLWPFYSGGSDSGGETGSNKFRDWKVATHSWVVDFIVLIFVCQFVLKIFKCVYL